MPMSFKKLPWVYRHYPECYVQCLHKAMKRLSDAVVMAHLVDPSSSSQHKRQQQSSEVHIFYDYEHEIKHVT